MDKEYLGDSVYIKVGRWRGELILTTENGLPNDPSNIIYLDDLVVRSLLRYISRMKEEVADERLRDRTPNASSDMSKV